MFNNEIDVSRRASTFNEPATTALDMFQVDPWSVFSDLLSLGIEGLERSLFWLRIMAVSAVEIPITILKQLFQGIVDRRAPLSTVVELLDCTVISMWLKTFAGYGLHKEILMLHSFYSEYLSVQIRQKRDTEEL